MMGYYDMASLIEDLKGDHYKRQRTAVDTLGEIGDARALELLTQALRENEGSPIQNDIVAALVKIGDLKGFQVILETCDPYTRLGTIKYVVGLRPPTGESRDIWLGDWDAVFGDRGFDKGALTDLLIRALGDSDPGVRTVAALALGSVPDDPRVIEALRQALGDHESTVYSEIGLVIPALGTPGFMYYAVSEIAGLTLARLGDKESEQRIVQFASRLVSKRPTSCYFLKYLYELGWESVIPELARRLQKMPEAYVRDRQELVKCLGTIGSPEVIEPLTQALKDNHKDVRKEAAQALGDIGNPGALAALTEAKNDKHRSVRGTAKKAIKKIEKQMHTGRAE